MSQTLLLIILTSTVSSMLAILCAYFINIKFLIKFSIPSVSISIGFIFSICFLHGLPEAFIGQSPSTVHKLFAVFLFGILTFFILEKSSIIRHNHHYEKDGHNHEHGYDKKIVGHNGNNILIGDGLHTFADGIMIAAAFLHDHNMGLLVSIAIFAHEIPLKISGFLVLINSGFSKQKALLVNLFLGTAAIIGGIIGYSFLYNLLPYMPYILVFAYSSLIYVAISDLLPKIQFHNSKSEYLIQLLCIIFGLSFMYVLLEILEHIKG